MSKYIELTQDNFEATVNKGVSMVDFWAPWCGPCRMLAPVIDELAEDFDGKANICKVDVDENQLLASDYQVRALPSILFFKNGKEVDRITGVASKQDIINKLNKYI